MEQRAGNFHVDLWRDTPKALLVHNPQTPQNVRPCLYLGAGGVWSPAPPLFDLV